jgi:hypothetical protein
VANKSIIQSKTPSKVTHTPDNIHHNRFIFILVTLYFAFVVLTAVLRGELSSGVRRHAVLKEFTDVSEESTASIMSV